VVPEEIDSPELRRFLIKSRWALFFGSTTEIKNHHREYDRSP
jgi:hypothetical protein